MWQPVILVVPWFASQDADIIAAIQLASFAFVFSLEAQSMGLCCPFGRRSCLLLWKYIHRLTQGRFHGDQLA